MIALLVKDYAIIMGHIPTAAEIKERYRVDEVKLNIILFLFSCPTEGGGGPMSA